MILCQWKIWAWIRFDVFYLLSHKYSCWKKQQKNILWKLCTSILCCILWWKRRFFYYKLKCLLNKAIWISKKRGTQRESQIIPCCICSNANISMACCWCVVLKKISLFPLHRKNEQMMKILLLKHRAICNTIKEIVLCETNEG